MRAHVKRTGQTDGCVVGCTVCTLLLLLPLLAAAAPTAAAGGDGGGHSAADAAATTAAAAAEVVVNWFHRCRLLSSPVAVVCRAHNECRFQFFMLLFLFFRLLLLFCFVVVVVVEDPGLRHWQCVSAGTLLAARRVALPRGVRSSHALTLFVLLTVRLHGYSRNADDHNCVPMVP